MAKEAVGRFLQRLSEDDKLREVYGAALRDATDTATVDVARSGGFEFTVEELRTVFEERVTELSDEQLREVAGGVGPYAGLVARTKYSLVGPYLNPTIIQTGGR